MSRRPDFLHRRRNFDARGTFYVVFLSSDCFNKKNKKYFRFSQSNYFSRIILSHIPSKLLSVSWKWIG